jgi:hypothetical protein
VPHARVPPPVGPRVWAWAWAWAWRGVARQAGGERADGRVQVLPLNPRNYRSFSLLWCRWVDCASYRLFVSPSHEFLGWLSPSPWTCIIVEVFRQSNLHFAFWETTYQPPFGFPRPVSLRARSNGRAGASETLIRLRTLHGVCGD